MKKNLFFTLIAVALFAVGCSGDPFADFPELNDNQVYYAGEVVNVESILDEKGTMTDGVYTPDVAYGGFFSTDDRLRFHLFMDPGMMNKTVDLTDPIASVGNRMFQISMLDNGEMAWELNCIEKAVTSNIGGTEHTTTCFKNGEVKITHNDDGFTMELKGIMLDDSKVAFRMVVPEKLINYMEK